MPRKAAERQAPKNEEGTFYVRSDGYTYKAPKINASEILKILDNKYVKQGLNDMMMTIFQEDMEVRIVGKDKKEDPDLTDQLQDMVSKKDVALQFSTKRNWRDVMEWGAGFRNPVWDYGALDPVTGELQPDNEYRLLKLNRYPPQSFATRGTGVSTVYNRVLPGVCLNEKTQQPEYWQLQNSGKLENLTNVHMTIDPMSGEFGGSPYIVPIFPFIKMISFSWLRQMGKVNMWGTGGAWTIEVTDPINDDMEFAKKFLKTFSATNKAPLRPNMKLIDLGVSGDGSALETITEIGMQLRQFFIPSDLAKDGGSLIGGTNTAEFKKYVSFVKGMHRWIEWDAYLLLQPWVIVNRYAELGYRLEVDLKAPEIDKSELWLKIAREGDQAGTIDENEHRDLLNKAGADLKPLDEVTLQAMRDRKAAAAVNNNPFNPQLQKAQVLAGMHSNNPLIGYKASRAFVQKTLGISEGETDPGELDLQTDARQAIDKLARASEDLAKASKR